MLSLKGGCGFVGVLLRLNVILYAGMYAEIFYLSGSSQVVISHRKFYLKDIVLWSFEMMRVIV